jgi:hypothetical protein
MNNRWCYRILHRQSMIQPFSSSHHKSCKVVHQISNQLEIPKLPWNFWQVLHCWSFPQLAELWLE